LQALLFVRQLALVLPPPAMERCMSGVYRAYASNAKFMSAANLPHLTFMASAMVEMTSLDLGTAYQVNTGV
jgi:nucleolar complex protein 2